MIFKRSKGERLIRRIIAEELDRRASAALPLVLPDGYNPLEKIRGGLFHWVQVPFNGVQVWCELRCMNATQINACGVYSDIAPKEEGKVTRENMIDMRNYQEKLIIGTLNRPTYDEIASLVGEHDFVLSAKRKELLEIKQTDLSGLAAKERAELQRRMDDTELFLGFILPEDTFGFLTSWVHGNDISDIKKITNEQFLEAAILAERGKDNPTDHLDGVFTDHNRGDMDRHAWGLYADFLKDKGVEKKAARRVIGGPKKR
jgi:hypothetical protein